MNKGLLLGLSLWVDVFLFWGLFHFGILQFLLIDKSYISFGVIGLYWIANFLLIWLYFHNNDPKNVYTIRLLEWIPVAFLNLGLLGTVVGLVTLFHQIFDGFNFSNTEDLKKVINQLTTGFSIAGLTTISGIAAFLMFTLKMVWLEKNDESKE